MDGRYAPSPSGDLHLGNLRTALVAWLQARAVGSRFLIRVDDLDQGRSREAFARSQLNDLAALGLDHDGEIVRQSRRTSHYEQALQQLKDEGRIYECYCTRAEIREAASAPHGAGPEGAYPGTCRHLTTAQREQKRKHTRRPPALRVRADEARVSVDDRIAGTITTTVDDFVVRRADGGHAYNLATVVDDADQGVEEVVRGADLLETTPRQLWLAQQLHLSTPKSYVHVPLVHGADGTRLAKRHGPATLADHHAGGWTTPQVLAELARSIGVDHTPATAHAADLIAHWKLAKLPHTAVTLDLPARHAADAAG